MLGRDAGNHVWNVKVHGHLCVHTSENFMTCALMLLHVKVLVKLNAELLVIKCLILLPICCVYMCVIVGKRENLKLGQSSEGGYSIYPWVGRCGPAPHTLTLFKKLILTQNHTLCKTIINIWPHVSIKPLYGSSRPPGQGVRVTYDSSCFSDFFNRPILIL